MLDIVTIGECLIECSTKESLSESLSFDKYFGGDTLAFSVTALRMGSKVGFISHIGDDFFKDFLLESLKKEGFDLSFIKIVEGTNGAYFLGKSKNNEKEVISFRKKTAASTINLDDIDENYIKNASVFYSSGITQSISSQVRDAVLKGFKLAKENNLLTAYDPNFVPRLWNDGEAKEAFEDVLDYVDILFLNLTKDVKTLYGIDSVDSVIKYFWDRGVKVVIIKSKEDKGFYIGLKNDIVFIKFYNLEVNDDTGAGDAFNGAFLHAICSGFGYIEACKFASVASGLQVKNVGMIKSVPYRDEVYDGYEKFK